MTAGGASKPMGMFGMNGDMEKGMGMKMPSKE